VVDEKEIVIIWWSMIQVRREVTSNGQVKSEGRLSKYKEC